MKTRTETRATRPPIVERLAAIRRRGLAGTTHGYRLEACVVLAEPCGPDTLRAFCREQLSGYKVPELWLFLDALPRNPNGKVLRATLVDKAVASF